MFYRHKKTGIIYNRPSFSHWHGVIIHTFTPLNNKGYDTKDKIEVSTNDIIDVDKMYEKYKSGSISYLEYCKETNKNVINAENHFLEIFEEIDSEPKIELVEIAPGFHMIQYICPWCGKPLKQEGGAYLTYPPQYDNFCKTDNCGYWICTSRWHSGMIVCGMDKDDILRVITSGTSEEQENLYKISRIIKRMV